VNLVPLRVEHLHFGQPLGFALRSPNGVLLAQRGFVIRSRAELEAMGGHGGLYVDASESPEHLRAFAGHLHEMVMKDAALGQIAQSQIDNANIEPVREALRDEKPDWTLLQSQANATLLAAGRPDFLQRLERLDARLSYLLSQGADAVLLALMHLGATQTQFYSATHALLVSAMCRVTAGEVLQWPAAQVSLVGRAALTMNVAITALQDTLVAQAKPPFPPQQQQLDVHGAAGAELLQAAGVSDADWLEAVVAHHARAPGPLAERSTGQRLARLIQRADIYAACLAPRAYRAALPAVSAQAQVTAMQACYFDEERHVDEAGAALIKAIGLYPPGSVVRLASQELAVVLRRTRNAAAPRVAVVVNRQGMAVGDPIVRQTDMPEFRVTASVPQAELKVHLDLERLVALI